MTTMNKMYDILLSRYTATQHEILSKLVTYSVIYHWHYELSTNDLMKKTICSNYVSFTWQDSIQKMS